MLYLTCIIKDGRFPVVTVVNRR
ncbi:BnaC02g01220D [Brassica napus]|uniref:BnaC02g01220D protein n=1 Tax=Brassica napus TaxID=3708 RepID=A0A078I1M3_BRANA|nr:BnaC02g01220D [Brassica napus]